MPRYVPKHSGGSPNKQAEYEKWQREKIEKEIRDEIDKRM